MIRSFQFLTVAVLMLFIAACDKNDETVTDVSATEAQAYAELETQLFNLSNASINNTSDLDAYNFDGANALYKSVLESSPTSPTANLGAALTEVFGAYRDPAVNSVIKRWENYSGSATEGTHLFRFRIPTGIGDMKVPQKEMAENIGLMIFKAMADPPTIAEMQTVLRVNFVPRIEYALLRLAVVESNPTFEFRISGRMQGDPGISPVYLDLTEVYVMDAMLRSMKASIDQFLVYQFNLPSYTTKAAVEALQPGNTTFFTLAPDGLTRSAGIQTNLLTLIERLRSGITYLKAESDNQSDDIIKRPSNTSDIDTVYSYLGQATTWLTQSQTVDIRDGDTDGNDYTVQVNLNALFTNPPQNPKLTWLPPYTVDSTATGELVFRWTQQSYDAFTFPDPTFGGVFPGMTNATLKRLMHIDESFAWMLEVNIRDDNYTLSPSTAVTVTVNGQVYQPKPKYSYGWSGYLYRQFLILNNDGQTAQINVTDFSTPIPIELDRTLTVQLKSSIYGEIDVTQAPQNISVIGFGPNSRHAEINLMQYAPYVIERRTTGSFGEIGSIWSSYYYDYSVPSAGTYEYRARRTMNPYFWGGFAGTRANNYSNTASVDIP